MHDPRINTVAALAIVTLFGIGALVIIERAILNINWMYVQLDATSAPTKTQ